MANETGKWPLPEGWKWTRVGDIAEVKGGKRLPKGSAYADGPTSNAYIRVKDFTDQFTVDTEQLVYIDEATHAEISKYTISSDDVFISIAGTIGKVGSIPEKLDGANLTENAAKITDLEGINSRYLIYALAAEYSRWQIAQLTTSSNQPKLALFRIKTIEFPLAPLPEQERIVAEIEKQFTRLDTAVAALERVQAGLARYKASVLKAAVEGRLVPQDPAAEPAERLLQRILAERRAKWEAAELEKMAAKGKTPKNEKWKAKYKEPQGPDTADLPQLPVGWVWATVEQLVELSQNGISKRRSETGTETIVLRLADIVDGTISTEDVRRIRLTESEIA